MTPLAVMTRFSLPDWAHRALSLAGPGRPLAPRPEAMARGLSLCPATAAGLLHPEPAAFAPWGAPWTPWSDAEAL